MKFWHMCWDFQKGLSTDNDFYKILKWSNASKLHMRKQVTRVFKENQNRPDSSEKRHLKTYEIEIYS